ncbi:MAG: ferredoxin [Mycoplasma sp.]
MSDKKYIIIDRDNCIGCGACVIASENRIDFVQGKAWAEKGEFDEVQEIIEVCPVEAISAASESEYDEAKAKNKL